jgi:predicted RNase H-like HicB family nuclease
MSEDTVEYVVRVHQEQDGSFWAEVRDLPGCFASGDTLDELRDALEEAISLYTADAPTAGGPASAGAPRRAMRVGEMRVKVPA